MTEVGLHPRLAHMLLRARELGVLPLAADLAALLSERDLIRGLLGAHDVDIRTRLELLHGAGPSAAVDRGALQRARRMAQELVRSGTSAASFRDEDTGTGVLLAFAYPDRIGRRRAGGEARYTLANGRGAHFAAAQTLSRQEFIVAIDLDDRERDARILLAAPLTREDIEAYMSDRLEPADIIEWDSREQAVAARRVLRLDALTIEEKPLRDAPRDALQAAMLQGVRELGIAALPWNRDSRDLQARMEFVRQGDKSWPVVDDVALQDSVAAWLGPWLEGITRREHLVRLPLAEALKALLSFKQQRELETLAPTHLQVPSGSRIRIDYLDESAPVVAVRLQEVFGLTETPRIGAGRIPITFKLLSPAQRPVQVTRDLAGFWRGSYAEVRKDMRGRYPRHHWPENPLQAPPHRGRR